MPGERGRQTRREDGKPHAGGPGRLTHAERVIDPASGLTKGDLARYYTQAAPLMRPYLKGRPVSLVRAPSGIGGDLFFQRHMDAADEQKRKHADDKDGADKTQLLADDGKNGIVVRLGHIHILLP